MPAGSAVDCQVGLTLSHMAVWKALASSGQPAAWVFECAPPSRLWLPGGSLDPRYRECCPERELPRLGLRRKAKAQGPAQALTVQCLCFAGTMLCSMMTCWHYFRPIGHVSPPTTSTLLSARFPATSMCPGMPLQVQPSTCGVGTSLSAFHQHARHQWPVRTLKA